MKNTLWVLLVIILAVAGIVALWNQKHTMVELTVHGGFAYIEGPTPNTVSVAFMKSWDAGTCHVMQLGVALKVDDGNVIEPAGQTTFDPSGAVITFEGAD